MLQVFTKTRFMTVCDARGKIRKVWGGYSPKVYASHFVLSKHKWFEKHVKKTKRGNQGIINSFMLHFKVAIIADSHFHKAAKEMAKSIRWHTTGKKSKEETITAKNYRKAVHQARA